MRYVFIILILLLYYFDISAQSNIQYTYDATGNRIQRKVVTTLVGEGSDEAMLRAAGEQGEAAAAGNDLAKTDAIVQQTQVFPNPTQDRLRIQLREALPGAVIELFDLSGRSLLRQSMPDTSTSIDLRAQEAGTYILIIRAKDFVAQWKVLKQSH